MPAGAKLVYVKPGTVVRQALTPNDGSDPSYNYYYVLKDDPAISGKDVTNPSAQTDTQTGQEVVAFGFRGSAVNTFLNVTAKIAQRGSQNTVGGNDNFQHFAIVLDTRLVTVPSIDFTQNPNGIDATTGGQIRAASRSRPPPARERELRVGALPINLEVISSRRSRLRSATQALNQGLIAGLVGPPGRRAVPARLLPRARPDRGRRLAIYAIYFFALIKLIPITLTLPGIAGLILTIGVAADANIVIFERVKEEIARRPLAVERDRRRLQARLRAIVDANAVTFMTAFILFMLAQPDVKGFAFTLGIGTIVSLFTAVAATRAILDLGRTTRSSAPARCSACASTPAWRFDFMGRSRWFFTMSGTILRSARSRSARSGINFGIDFVRGTQIQATFVKRASIAKRRTRCSPR